VEERDKGIHDDDDDSITMTTLPLLLSPPDDLKKNSNQLNWEDAAGNGRVCEGGEGRGGRQQGGRSTVKPDNNDDALTLSVSSAPPQPDK
jgi:hypothetical protein